MKFVVMLKINKQKDLLLQNKKFRFLQFFSNWLMQGTLHADFSEKLYKICFTFFTTLSSYLILNYFNSDLNHKIIVAFFIGHSINWIVNCNLFVLLVHRIKIKKISKAKLFNQLISIRSRFLKLSNYDWILYCVSHGGICNGTLNEYSDIDVSIIRKPGFKNFIYSVLFYIREKKIADIKGVPLDIFICDSPYNSISRSNYQKNPIVLFDPNNQIDNYYKENKKISIEESMVLNKYKQ